MTFVSFPAVGNFYELPRHHFFDEFDFEMFVVLMKNSYESEEEKERRKIIMYEIDVLNTITIICNSVIYVSKRD
jgi:hypothetical protein